MHFRLAKLAGAATVAAISLTLAAGAGTAGAASTSTTTITGPITALSGASFTIQTSGRQVGVINALSASATKITNMNTPYVWGGGHAEAGVASVGEKGGPGFNGKRTGFDCSGSVAAVLAGAGLWPAGAGVPSDNGIISELLAEHLIARGVGSAPDAVTLYDDPGVHIFMNIDGRFFGTSDGAGGGDQAGGAGWLDDGAWDASSPQYKKYHFLPSVLAQKTSYGNNFTFVFPASGLFAATKGGGQGVSLGELNASDLLVGEKLRVAYTARSTGQMVVSSVAVISGGPALTAPTSPTTPTPTPTTTGSTTPTTTTPTTSATTTPGATTLSTPTVTVPGTVTVPSTTVTVMGTPVSSPSSGGSGSAYGVGAGLGSGNPAVTDAETGGASAGGYSAALGGNGGGRL